jgi:hypothetical protein
LGAILALLARPLIEAAVSAFGHVLMDFVRSWKASQDAQARGRAEAERDAAVAVARVEREMGGVDVPSLREMLNRLKDGSA